MIQLIGKQGKTFYMITETIILPAKLPDNAFKSAYYLLVEIELTPENTLVKLTSNNSSGIIQAAKELG
ncbi:MAG: hypothetical protein QG594_547, partial [Bacteroidota bacterium]|nr:hypothetical protein [Bacteroidota bacterium]